ncbi:UNVERIFIED_CONTAM: hypothetical protein RMT77_009348 [Armadillidium vulgare]
MMGNYSVLKLIFIFSILQPYFSAEALRCYVCRPDGSESDQELRDVFTAVNQQSGSNGRQTSACSTYDDEDDIPLVQCRGDSYETRCVKFAKLRSGRRDDFIDEDDFSGRGCLTIAKPNTNFIAAEGWAKHQLYNQITMHYCDEDACNAADGIKIRTLLMAVPIFLLLGRPYLL